MPSFSWSAAATELPESDFCFPLTSDLYTSEYDFARLATLLVRSWEPS